MAWTTPRTWLEGELVTNTMMNEQIRDNLDYLNDSKCAWARVRSDATIDEQSGGITAGHPATGSYNVDFPAEVGAVFVTPDDTVGSTITAVATKVSTLRWAVGVQNAGVAIDRDFRILGITL